jgi:transcriptional regulator with XRE-family HTH domain
MIVTKEPVTAMSSNTVAELQQLLGGRVRQLRLRRNMDQLQVAAKAAISEKALRNLESGRGSQVGTLLAVLKALDALDGLDALAPHASVSPLAVLERRREPQRVGRPRKPAAAGPATGG